jgi:hypothetical protein
VDPHELSRGGYGGGEVRHRHAGVQKIPAGPRPPVPVCPKKCLLLDMGMTTEHALTSGGQTWSSDSNTVACTRTCRVSAVRPH